MKVIARKRVNFVKFFSIITLDMTGSALYNGAEFIGINRAMDEIEWLEKDSWESPNFQDGLDCLGVIVGMRRNRRPQQSDRLCQLPGVGLSREPLPTSLSRLVAGAVRGRTRGNGSTACTRCCVDSRIILANLGKDGL
jgi:hypothetical protein